GRSGPRLCEISGPVVCHRLARYGGTMAGQDMTARPKIGVTTSQEGGAIMWGFCKLAIDLTGGDAVRIHAGEEGASNGLDGLLIGGGDDVAPTLYGGVVDPAIRIDPERDRLELDCIEHANRRRLPILGICRGAQILNI